MSEFSTSILIIGTEIGAVFLIIAIILFAIQRKKKSKERKIREEFVSTFKDNLEIRRKHIEQQLMQIDQDKDEIIGIIDNIITKEKSICAKVLKIFNGKDKDLILDMQGDLQDLTDQFGMHIVNEENTTATVSPDIEARIKEMEKRNNVLKTENDRLKDDLKKSLETIDSIQAEYEQLYKKTKDLENK